MTPPPRQVLRDAKMDKTAVDDVVLVGGSTRIPKVMYAAILDLAAFAVPLHT